ncbi:ArsR/SmtB family transcription factor [Micromonospora sp. NPDC004336]
MHAFDILGDPVRRRIIELLADGELSAGEVGAVVQREFGISQPGVSQHLRVLRENGFATVRPQGTRRLYAVDPAPLEELDRWLDRYRRFWNQRLDALGTELARGRARAAGGRSAGAGGPEGDAGGPEGRRPRRRATGDSQG